MELDTLTCLGKEKGDYKKSPIKVTFIGLELL